jgi:hypothetical protein
MIIIIALLIGLNAYQFYFSYKERKQLLNRIQARDVIEYKALEAKTPKAEKKEETKPVNFL